MGKTITEAVLEYQRCRILSLCVLHTAGTILYEYLLKKRELTEDERNDFFCYFYPKIPSLFDRFVYVGKPFEGYLLISARWQLKSFIYKSRQQESRNRHLEFDTWRDVYAPGYSRFLLPDTSGEAAAELKRVFGIDPASGKTSKSASNRRILYVLMRGALYSTDDILNDVAAATGFDPDWLYNCIEKLKIRMEQRRGRLEYLKQRRNCIFIKILDLHREINKAVDQTEKHDLIVKLLLLQKHLRTTLDEISRTTTEPSHKDIAEVLGIPKGSVDSGMYCLKHTLENYSGEHRDCA